MADSNKRKCLTAYDSSWKKDFPIGPTSQNKHGFYCHPCQKVISLGHMGRGHGANHYDPKGDTVHNKNVNSINKSTRISQFLVSTPPTKEQATINAEVLHANFIVQHNQPFAKADHLSKVINLLCQ